MNKQDEKNLRIRYLVWLYKTTKERFDSFESRFTQLDIDNFILKEIEKKLKGSYLPGEKKEMEKMVNDFRAYISDKEEECFKLKYKEKKIDPEFLFLDIKLEAIEKAIAKETNKKTLDEFKEAYQQEMLARIMEEK